jgi:hypothetical protein
MHILTEYRSPAKRAAITCLRYSEGKRFLIEGHASREMIVRSAEDPQRFMRLAAHDSERGRVHAVSISHDECLHSLLMGAFVCIKSSLRYPLGQRTSLTDGLVTGDSKGQDIARVAAYNYKVDERSHVKPFAGFDASQAPRPLHFACIHLCPNRFPKYLRPLGTLRQAKER